MSDDINTGTFLLNLSGQLEWAELPDVTEEIYCHIEFVIGPDWKILNGLESIISQTVVPTLNKKFILNLPIELLLESTNIYGWPQIVLSCYNGEKCVGVGRCYIPIKHCNDHHIKFTLSRPCHMSLLTKLFDKRPSFRDTKVLANPHVTPLLRMESCGMASVCLNTSIQGLKALGYQTGN